MKQFKVGDRVKCGHPNPLLNGATGTVEQIIPRPTCHGHWAGHVVKMDSGDQSSWLMEESELTLETKQ